MPLCGSWLPLNMYHAHRRECEARHRAFEEPESGSEAEAHGSSNAEVQDDGSSSDSHDDGSSDESEGAIDAPGSGAGSSDGEPGELEDLDACEGPPGGPRRQETTGHSYNLNSGLPM